MLIDLSASCCSGGLVLKSGLLDPNFRVDGHTIRVRTRPASRGFARNRLFRRVRNILTA
jgi:hypothetical protein